MAMKLNRGYFWRTVLALITLTVFSFVLAGPAAAACVRVASLRAETREQVKTVQQKMDEMTLDEKILQMFIVTPEVLNGSTKTEFSAEERLKQAGSETLNSLRKRPVGGIIYFADNLESRSQTKTMIANTQSYARQTSGIPLFICVDEEGGIVARCAKKLGTTKFKPMQSYENQGTQTAHDNAQTIAKDIRQFGFNVDFAPVADVNLAKNSVIGTRAYSSSPQKAAELIPAAVRGFHDGGVVCTLKHFPGHGDTQEDSHKETAHLKKSLSQLRKAEYLPFQAGIDAGADMVMVGHIVTDQIDPKYPATLSKTIVTDILRGQLGFQGLVVTDSMGMGAISSHYSPGEAAVLAIAAGDDLLLGVYNVPEALAGVRSAVQSGRLSQQRIDQSVRRILMKKVQMGLLK